MAASGSRWSISKAPFVSKAEQTLPWAPRPFEGEALGSWLGRLAAAYGLTVDEFAGYAGVTLDCGEDTENWLAIAEPSRRDRRRLAALCRLPISQLPDAFISSSNTRSGRLAYCHRCLVLNPLDVTAPYWQARWLSSNERERCPNHGLQYEYIRLSALRQHRNMKRLLRFVSRDRLRRQRASLH